ncbi:hypothetical protein BN1723_007498 [Verticillium longisporum]|uniref:Ribosomal RNA methyltransferase FtsJ domain-containing protein n=1 Tax=Verticillium longisporum TaxID=100787 RepID=A0A0G4MPG4_VERLO|nr:hypothetical protein HYQ44_005059 [Verticillium longisporum]CRK36198.1 hypothetical protein BN1708_006972 [Verticillium longisporum]CRK47359.1 hypothetical protein BN1723_007498 [Verticillium longisporum]
MSEASQDKPDGEASWSDSRGWNKASSIIVPYLIERVPEFHSLTDLRQRGWNNPEGDKFFQLQRQRADQSNEKTARYFYQLMLSIGREIQAATGAFSIVNPASQQPEILDMCMAPGGFLQTALSFNPGSKALGFSLPISHGGHKILLPRRADVDLRFLDVTMLAADMGSPNIPVDHIDAEKFLPRQIDTSRVFDLVLCDGQVLRTHDRAPYREKREARRLTTVQLALGLEHLRSGGTMIVVLHKLEAWDTLCLVRLFTRFASIKLFKPIPGHAKRSSFYMVASCVQSQQPEALAAISKWKNIWNAATFAPDEKYWEEIRKGEEPVSDVLEEFGPELIKLGRKGLGCAG